MEQTTSNNNRLLSTPGHRKTCHSKKNPNIMEDGKRIVRCRDANSKGGQCSGQVCMLGCVDNVNDQLLGRCVIHYAQYCKKKRWDSNLSMCANKKCDALSYTKRKNINQYNINKILGLSGEKDCNHISKSRREDADSEDEYSSSESESESTPKKLPQRDSKVIANNTIDFINDIICGRSVSSGYSDDDSSQAEDSDDNSSEEDESSEDTLSSDTSFKEEDSFESDKIPTKSKIVFGARPTNLTPKSKTIFTESDFTSNITPASSSCLQQ